MICGPAHAFRLGWKIPFGLCGALPHVVQTVGDPIGPLHGALGRVFILRRVFQPMALPTTEVAPAVDLASTPTARDALQPSASAPKPGGRMHEGHELVDTDLGAIVSRDGVHQSQAVRLHADAD